MEKYLPIENNTQYARDTSSGAVVLRDLDAMDKYKAERKRRVDEKLKMRSLENEIEDIKKELFKLTGILQSIKKD